MTILYEKLYHVGLDVGSTTVKVAVLDEKGTLCHKKYQRHYSDVKKTIAEVLEETAKLFSEDRLTLMVTGSGGINVATWLDIPLFRRLWPGWRRSSG